MSHPRIEEVEDSDVEMSDPSEGDIDDFVESDILRPRNKPSSSSSSTSKQLPIRQPPPSQASSTKSHLINPSQIPSISAGPGPSGAAGDFSIPTTANAKGYADFQCLYPIYFDASRTRAEGRRVAKEMAVPNPLAREIVNACRDLRLQTLFEPEKMHPKDWANPGRVKVQLKAGGGAGAGADKNNNNNNNNKNKKTAVPPPPPNGAAGVKNKHQLYVLVAQHLRNNPTTDRSQALWDRLPGPMPAPDRAKAYPKPAVPRGWKMGEYLPYYSPAMTGGGVSENLFKDMMKEMQGGGGGGGGGDMASLLAGAAGAGANGGGSGSGNASEDGAGRKKKDKKGKGKA